MNEFDDAAQSFPDDTPHEPLYACQVTRDHDWTHDIAILERCGHIRYKCVCGTISFSFNHRNECEQRTADL